MDAIPDSAQNAPPQEKNTPLAMQGHTGVALNPGVSASQFV
jgi:hypothetical protein